MAEDFYASYSAYKDYRRPSLTSKDIARFDAEIWQPAGFAVDMKCLEIGSGAGAFLAYLAHKGVTDFRGIDHDPALPDVQPPEVAERFDCADVWRYLETVGDGDLDRVVLLDVLEHFSPEQGFRLLSLIAKALGPHGKIIIKVPNAASPWGLSYQHGDLTHKTAYTADSLRQLATACALKVDAVYEQRRGSPRRMITDALVRRFLAWALLTPPPLWGANIYCLLCRE